MDTTTLNKLVNSINVFNKVVPIHLTEFDCFVTKYTLYTEENNPYSYNSCFLTCEEMFHYLTGILDTIRCL